MITPTGAFPFVLPAAAPTGSAAQKSDDARRTINGVGGVAGQSCTQTPEHNLLPVRGPGSRRLHLHGSSDSLFGILVFISSK